MSTFSTVLEGRVGPAGRVTTKIAFDTATPFLVTFTFIQRVKNREGKIEKAELSWEIGRELLLLGMQAGKAGYSDVVVVHDKEEHCLSLTLRNPEATAQVLLPSPPVTALLDTAEKKCAAKAMYDGFREQFAGMPIIDT